MKKFISLIIVLSLIFSSSNGFCDIFSSIIDSAVDNISDSSGITKKVSKVTKKAIKAKQENAKWDNLKEDCTVICKNTNTQKYLDNLLNKITKFSDKPRDHYSINILQTATVQGRIWLSLKNIETTRGMFNMINDEAELVCLLGHEIGHCVVRDQEEKDTRITSKKNKKKAIEKLSKAGKSLLKQSKITDTADRTVQSIWSQEEEESADKYGAELAYKAGYDPYAFCDLFERLSTRIDLDIIYKIGKLEGTHPTLDKRAKTLRKYLQEKGYKEGTGKRNRANFIGSMADLYAQNPKTPDNLTKQIDKQSKKDIKKLDKIIKELTKKTKKKETITVDQFFEIMETVSKVCKKYNITREDIFQTNKNQIIQEDVASFMEEKIVQETPFWEIFDTLKGLISGKVKEIFNMLAHIGVGTIPIVGDSIDLYEILSGKDAFTQEELTKAERILTAMGLLIGTGAMWRSFADSISTQATKSGLKDVDNIIDTIKKDYSSTIDSKIATRQTTVIANGTNEVTSNIGKESTNISTSLGNTKPKTDFYVKPNGDIVHATGYRYIDSSKAESAIQKGEQYTTYVGFIKYDSAKQAREAYQISESWSNAKVRAEFDTLQAIDKLYIPTKNGNTSTILEPLANSYPKFGIGGGYQMRVDDIIKFRDIKLIED